MTSKTRSRAGNILGAFAVTALFRDLSCLIGLIYYCTWLSENGIEEISITDPSDLNRTAEEIALLLQSPEIYQYLRAQEQDDEQNKKRGRKSAAAKAEPAMQKKKSRPALRVIENEHFVDPFVPDPVTV